MRKHRNGFGSIPDILHQVKRTCKPAFDSLEALLSFGGVASEGKNVLDAIALCLQSIIASFLAKCSAQVK